MFSNQALNVATVMNRVNGVMGEVGSNPTVDTKIITSNSWWLVGIRVGLIPRLNSVQLRDVAIRQHSVFR